MKIKGQIQGFIVGVAVSVLSIQVLAAPVQKAITVSYNNIKLYVDGNLIDTKDGNGNAAEPFIYNGTTYLPVRAVGEAFGKPVQWDGDTQSIYVGGKADTVTGQKEDKIYLGDQLKSYSKSAWIKEYPKDGNFNMGGKRYTRGLQYFMKMVDSQQVYYNLDAQYTTLSGLYGPTDDASYDRNGTVNIYGDGKLLGSFEAKNGDLPKEFSLNVTGVLQLEIEFEGASSFAMADIALQF